MPSPTAFQTPPKSAVSQPVLSSSADRRELEAQMRQQRLSALMATSGGGGSSSSRRSFGSSPGDEQRFHDANRRRAASLDTDRMFTSFSSGAIRQRQGRQSRRAAVREDMERVLGFGMDMGIPAHDLRGLEEELLLREAIRLSLADSQEERTVSNSSTGVASSIEDLVVRDEEEQLRIAIALSLQESGSSPSSELERPAMQDGAAEAPPPPASAVVPGADQRADRGQVIGGGMEEAVPPGEAAEVAQDASAGEPMEGEAASPALAVAPSAAPGPAASAASHVLLELASPHADGALAGSLADPVAAPLEEAVSLDSGSDEGLAGSREVDGGVDVKDLVDEFVDEAVSLGSGAADGLAGSREVDGGVDVKDLVDEFVDEAIAVLPLRPCEGSPSSTELDPPPPSEDEAATPGSPSSGVLLDPPRDTLRDQDAAQPAIMLLPSPPPSTLSSSPTPLSAPLAAAEGVEEGDGRAVAQPAEHLAPSEPAAASTFGSSLPLTSSSGADAHVPAGGSVEEEYKNEHSSHPEVAEGPLLPAVPSAGENGAAEGTVGDVMTKTMNLPLPQSDGRTSQADALPATTATE